MTTGELAGSYPLLQNGHTVLDGFTYFVDDKVIYQKDGNHKSLGNYCLIFDPRPQGEDLPLLGRFDPYLPTSGYHGLMVFPISNGRMIVRGHDGYLYGYDLTRDGIHSGGVAAGEALVAQRRISTKHSYVIYDLRGRIVETAAEGRISSAARSVLGGGVYLRKSITSKSRKPEAHILVK
jgi:hypothetical protein